MTHPPSPTAVQIHVEDAPLTPTPAEPRKGRPNTVTRQTSKTKTTNHFARAGGSSNASFNRHIFDRVMDTAWRQPGNDSAIQEIANLVYSALAAFKPVDEIEGMLAAQATSMHLASMECFRRAMIAEQPFEIAAKMRKDGVNLARGMTDMLEALDRKRGKGHQVVRVERVVVHEGGQAIVGLVAAGMSGGSHDGRTEGQAYTPRS